MHLPPSQKPNLIGGHFRKFRKDPTGFLTAQANLGDISFFRMGSQPGYFLNHPDLVRDVFVVNAHKFMKGRALQRAKNLLGQGLLTSEGEFHLRQRRMIQPAFHRARIAEYAKSMIEFADKTSESWRDGDVRDIDKEMMHLTLQIVVKRSSAHSAAALVSALTDTFARFRKEAAPLRRTIIDHTRAHPETDQVFVVTRLPRGSLDPLFAEDAK